MCKLPVFRERLNQLLRESGGTIVSFAASLGISRQSLGYYLNGERIPDALILRQMAEKCNVSADWLLGLSDAKKNTPSTRAACAYTGLSEDAVNALEWFSYREKMRDKPRLSCLSKALASPEVLETLAALMSIQSSEREYCEGPALFVNDIYLHFDTPYTHASSLHTRLQFILEAIRTDNTEALPKPYQIPNQMLQEVVEKALSEKVQPENGGADHGKS